MSKKYLLYIHDDQFQLEKNKSELINRLLAEHYASQPGAVQRAIENGDIIVKPGKIIKTTEDIPKIMAKVGPSTRQKKFDNIAKDGKNNSESKDCPNGHPADWRGKCFDKKCKYSK